MKCKITFAIAGICSLLLASCASTGGKQGPQEQVNRQGEGQAQKKEDNQDYVSAKRETLVNSFTNNPMTSHTISIQKAERQAAQLSPKAKDKRTLEGRISALRLARRDVSLMLDTAKSLADIEMAKGGVSNQIDDDVKLELAIGAVQAKKFALAEYYLIDLYNSKNPKVRAGAYNLTGVIALRNDRIPTAVVNFKEALKHVSSYEPAQLNLGFVALRGGDTNTAQKAMSNMQNDWFVQTGQIVMGRLEGQRDRVDGLCDKLTARNHKPTLFNCGLQELQVKKDYGKARQLMGRALKAPGSNEFDRSINQALAKIGQEEAAARKAAATKSQDKKPAQEEK